MSTGIELQGITATIDPVLTDDAEFLENSRDLENDQIVAGAEVLYHFNKFGGE